jgi:hypothetical protein
VALCDVYPPACHYPPAQSRDGRTTARPGTTGHAGTTGCQTALELFFQEDNGTIGVHVGLVIFSPFVLRSSDGNGNPLTALGTLILDFADGAQLTVPPVAVPDDSWELNYRYDSPERHIRPLERLRSRARRDYRG